MKVPVSLKIALRELRGGLKGFRVFLACLILGIAAIAAIGTVRHGIEQSLVDKGAELLGGDAEMSFTYRYATKAEKRWMASHASVVSEIIDFRSMAVMKTPQGSVRGLSEVKAVDSAYPLYGRVRLDPPIPLKQALAGHGGLPGAVMHPVLAERMGLVAGSRFFLGSQEFYLAALLEKIPDSAAEGFGLGPPTIVLTRDLDGAGLLGPGSLFNTKYRLKVDTDEALSALKRKANRKFRDAGLHWHDRRNAAPGIRLFADRIASFLVLVGLAGLAVGGIGVSSAVRAYLATKTATIATLRTLGADGGLISRVYFLQIGVLSVLGIVLGLALGVLLPFAFIPLLAGKLPLVVGLSIDPASLVEAAIYGTLMALLFTVLPIGRTRDIRPAALFRDAVEPTHAWPAWPFLLAAAGVVALMLATVLWYASVPWLALWTLCSIAAAMVVLFIVAVGVRRLARAMAHVGFVRGRTALRLALGAIGGPASEAVPVILSLGLGLSVLATVGQIDSNLRGAIANQLPAVAPTFFFVDIQSSQLDGFLSRTTKDKGVSRVETAPMLRGVITRINGRSAREVAGDHWVVRGDRGVTFSAAMPKGTVLTEGAWWPVDYTGEPLVSFAADEAHEIGLVLGDHLTINILGRDIEARISSFRKVDFSSAGIGFVLVINPAAVAGAPHSLIATVYAPEASEAAILRDIGDAFPNITAIRVRDVIDRIVGMMKGLAGATSLGALATLVTGFVVLIGAAAAGEPARRYEAAILKTIGAGSGRILLSFALRSILLGLAAGGVAVFAGAMAGWAVMHFVMETGFRFEPVSALLIVGGGALVAVLSGLAFAISALRQPPAGILRARE